MAEVIWVNAQGRFTDNLSRLPGMDPASLDLTNIPARLRQHRRSQAELARFLKIDPSSLTKTIKGERQLKAAEMLRIEEFFGGAGEVEDNARPFQPARKRPSGRIPVYGYDAGDGERVLMSPGREVDWIELSPSEVSAGEQVGLRVSDERLEPRYFVGEIAVARMGVPPAKGHDCIIEFRDGTAMLKVYRGQRMGRLFYREFNPDPQAELSVDASTVKALHPVLRRL